MSGVRRALMFALSLLELSSCQQASHPAARIQNDSSWLACGPFPLSLQEVSHDFGAAFQTKVDSLVSNMLTVSGAARSTTFRAACMKARKVVDVSEQDLGPASGRTRIDQLLPSVSDSVLFFERLISAQVTETMYLTVGSDDGFAVFLNGRMLASRIVDEEEGAKNYGGSIGDNKDLVEIVLRRGVNSLLIAVPQRKGAWGMTYRLGGKEEAARLLSELPMRPSNDVVTNPLSSERTLVVAEPIHRIFRHFWPTASVTLKDLKGHSVASVPLPIDSNVSFPYPLRGPFVVEVRSGQALVSQPVYFGRPNGHDVDRSVAPNDVLMQRVAMLGH